MEPHGTMDAIIRDAKPRDDAILNESAILGWNTCDVSSKIRPMDAEIAVLVRNLRRYEIEISGKMRISP